VSGVEDAIERYRKVCRQCEDAELNRAGAYQRLHEMSREVVEQMKVVHASTITANDLLEDRHEALRDINRASEGIS